MNADRYFLLACSPRAGGNTDAAANVFAEAYGDSNEPFHPEYLREYTVLPCTGCGACEAYAAHLQSRPGVFPYGCPLARQDASREVIPRLEECSGLCLVAPIYFYHMPAIFKALVDRLQPFWSLHETGMYPRAAQPRTCRIILIGARPTGEQLFKGTLLTLKYALGPMGFELAEPLLLYGVDKVGDLASNTQAVRRIQEYAQEARGERG